MAEWSKAPDSSSGLRERAWVQIPLLTLFLSTQMKRKGYGKLLDCNTQVGRLYIELYLSTFEKKGIRTNCIYIIK